MVINVGMLRGGTDAALLRVADDVARVARVCRASGATLKVILETCLLTDDEKRTAVVLCGAAGADFVKTSTGFSRGGATEHDVALMAAGAKLFGMQVKASGGIRNADDARKMIAAGATRLGTSRGVDIVLGAKADGGKDVY